MTRLGASMVVLQHGVVQLAGGVPNPSDSRDREFQATKAMRSAVCDRDGASSVGDRCEGGGN